MPSDSDLYQRFILQARSAHGKTVALTIKQLEAAYTDLVGQLVSIVRGSGTSIERTRAALMIRNLRTSLADYGLKTERIITSGIDRTVNATLQSHTRAIAALESARGVPVAHSFARVPREVFEAMLTKREFARAAGYEGFSSMFKTLQGTHLRTTAQAVDDAILSAVGTGKSSRQLAGELANLLTPSAEGQALLGASRGIGRTTIQRTAELLGTSPATVRSVQATLRRSELIAITEMNTAFHEADALATRRSTVIGAVRWELSGAHPEIDVCDVLAENDSYGKGKGVYPVNAIPALPHPRCLCGTYKIVLPPNKWNDPSARFVTDAPPITMTPTKARKIMGAKASPKAIERAANLASTTVDDAYQARTAATATTAKRTSKTAKRAKRARRAARPPVVTPTQSSPAAAARSVDDIIAQREADAKYFFDTKSGDVLNEFEEWRLSMGDFINSLSDAERAALQEYKFGSEDINLLARYADDVKLGGPSHVAEVKKQVAVIDDIMARAPELPAAARVKRFADMADAYPDVFRYSPDVDPMAVARGLKGTVLQDRGFLSTSSIADWKWYGNMAMEMIVPKGTRHIYLEEILEKGITWDIDDQWEFLLNRGLRWYITGVRYVTVIDRSGDSIRQAVLTMHLIDDALEGALNHAFG